MLRGIASGFGDKALRGGAGGGTETREAFGPDPSSTVDSVEGSLIGFETLSGASGARAVTGTGTDIRSFPESCAPPDVPLPSVRIGGGAGSSCPSEGDDSSPIGGEVTISLTVRRGLVGRLGDVPVASAPPGIAGEVFRALEEPSIVARLGSRTIRGSYSSTVCT